MLIFKLTVTFLSPGQFFSNKTHGGPHCANISPLPHRTPHSRDPSSSSTPFLLYLLFSPSGSRRGERWGRRRSPASDAAAGRAGGGGEARCGGSGGGGEARRGGSGAGEVAGRAGGGGEAPRSAAASRLLFFAKIFQHLFF